ncbi:MAG: hypothetical protein IJ646_03370 [Clostridia bacterium]|nr:hypothetical protein [Clostridia bacterium]
MAKHSEYQEKSKPLITALYIIVALALIAALAFMYIKDRNRRKQYDDLVLDAAASENSMDIAARKEGQELVPDEADELMVETATATPAPTATPTPAPTDTPAPTVAPTEAQPVADDASLPTVTPFIPDDKVVDEALAQGLED